MSSATLIPLIFLVTLPKLHLTLQKICCRLQPAAAEDAAAAAAAESTACLTVAMESVLRRRDEEEPPLSVGNKAAEHVTQFCKNTQIQDGVKC